MASAPPQNDHLTHLLSRVALHDHRAFEQLYGLTSAHLFGIALHIVKRPDRAEEVLQEAYVNVWNQAGSYAAGLASPMTWLISVVRNKALDWLRHVKLADESTAFLTDDEEDFMHQIADESAGPHELFSQTAEKMHLQHCMAALDGAQRQCLALAYYNGLTHAELATHLQAPLGTVKAWLRRGLEKLKKCLDCAYTVPAEI